MASSEDLSALKLIFLNIPGPLSLAHKFASAPGLEKDREMFSWVSMAEI